MRCSVAAYFSNMNQDIGIRVGRLVSSTLAKLKELSVFWHKIKEHLGVADNEHADKLANLAASSDLVLLVLVKEIFIKTGEMAMSGNEAGSGSAVISKDMIGNVDWHPDLYMAAGFINKSTTNLQSYFLKALYHCLLVAVQKHLYNKDYPSVLCLYYGEVKSSDHFFVCVFDSEVHKNLLAFYLAKWCAVSGLGLYLSQISQMLSLCISDDELYTTLNKDFLFRDWYLKAVSVLNNTKLVSRVIINFVWNFGAAHHADIWLVKAKYRVFMEKSGLVPHDGSVLPVTWSLLSLFLARVVRLLGVIEVLGVCFGFCKLCCFFSDFDRIVSVIINL
ncbi:hypothetical protein G9A89_017003 [Geosiphon pyriformis]|nr:hypothetical protein G9A89_017003 [Geosiphon pyriformis]